MTFLALYSVGVILLSDITHGCLTISNLHTRHTVSAHQQGLWHENNPSRHNNLYTFYATIADRGYSLVGKQTD